MAPENPPGQAFDLSGLPPELVKKIEYRKKNFRFVGPAQKTDAIAAKYPDVTYRRGYQLPEEATKPLAEKADPKCYKCLGTGIKDWRNGGLVARVCKCVPRNNEGVIVAGAVTAKKITADVITASGLSTSPLKASE